jgi:flagellar FliJ protein
MRSRRLEPIAQLADHRQQGAARSLRQSQEELDGYRRRLAELTAYQAEYLERFEKLGKTGITANNLKRFQGFLGQLSEAIGNLQGLIHLAEGQVDRRREEWLVTRARYRALEEVIERFRAEESRHRVRRDQRDADERSQRGPQRPR